MVRAPDDGGLRVQRAPRRWEHDFCPHVRVPHLASAILGRITRRLPADWQATYGYAPVLVETFVDTERFTGTCYRAANSASPGTQEARTPTRQRRGVQRLHADAPALSGSHHDRFCLYHFTDRGRDRPCGRPPAQIPACAANALGSCLGWWRRTARLGRGVSRGRVVAIGSRGGSSASS